MMITRRVLVVLFAVAFAAASTAALADSGMGGAREQMPAPFAGSSGLSTAQQSAWNGIYQEFHQKSWRLERQLQAEQYQLRGMLLEDNIDQAKIDSLVEQINNLRSQLFKNRVAMQVAAEKQGIPSDLLGPAWGCDMMGDYGPWHPARGHWDHHGHMGRYGMMGGGDGMMGYSGMTALGGYGGMGGRGIRGPSAQ